MTVQTDIVFFRWIQLLQFLSRQESLVNKLLMTFCVKTFNLVSICLRPFNVFFSLWEFFLAFYLHSWVQKDVCSCLDILSVVWL